MAPQLQVFLDEENYLQPSQSSFRYGYETETALVTWMDDLCRTIGSVFLLVLLVLSMTFDTTSHAILLDLMVGIEDTVLQ